MNITKKEIVYQIGVKVTAHQVDVLGYYIYTEGATLDRAQPREIEWVLVPYRRTPTLSSSPVQSKRA